MGNTQHQSNGQTKRCNHDIPIGSGLGVCAFCEPDISKRFWGGTEGKPKMLGQCEHNALLLERINRQKAILPYLQTRRSSSRKKRARITRYLPCAQCKSLETRIYDVTDGDSIPIDDPIWVRAAMQSDRRLVMRCAECGGLSTPDEYGDDDDAEWEEVNDGDSNPEETGPFIESLIDLQDDLQDKLADVEHFGRGRFL